MCAWKNCLLSHFLFSSNGLTGEGQTIGHTAAKNQFGRKIEIHKNSKLQLSESANS